MALVQGFWPIFIVKRFPRIFLPSFLFFGGGRGGLSPLALHAIYAQGQFSSFSSSSSSVAYDDGWVGRRWGEEGAPCPFCFLFGNYTHGNHAKKSPPLQHATGMEFANSDYILHNAYFRNIFWAIDCCNNAFCLVTSHPCILFVPSPLHT